MCEARQQRQLHVLLLVNDETRRSRSKGLAGELLNALLLAMTQPAHCWTLQAAGNSTPRTCVTCLRSVQCCLYSTAATRHHMLQQHAAHTCVICLPGLPCCWYSAAAARHHKRQRLQQSPARCSHPERCQQPKSSCSHCTPALSAGSHGPQQPTACQFTICGCQLPTTKTPGAPA